MFSNCYYLTSIDISSFNTSHVATMAYMFSCCSRLNLIDVSNFDTSQVATMSYMFSGCTRLNLIMYLILILRKLQLCLICLVVVHR